MAEYTFYTHPMSRGQIGRWALHEAGADYDQVLVDWADKPGALLAANAMGKVPTIVHHTENGDRTVSEAETPAAMDSVFAQKALRETADSTSAAPEPPYVAIPERWALGIRLQRYLGREPQPGSP